MTTPQSRQIHQASTNVVVVDYDDENDDDDDDDDDDDPIPRRAENAPSFHECC